VAQAGDPGVVFVPLPGGDPPGASRDRNTLPCRSGAVPSPSAQCSPAPPRATSCRPRRTSRC